MIGSFQLTAAPSNIHIFVCYRRETRSLRSAVAQILCHFYYQTRPPSQRQQAIDDRVRRGWCRAGSADHGLEIRHHHLRQWTGMRLRLRLERDFRTPRSAGSRDEPACVQATEDCFSPTIIAYKVISRQQGCSITAAEGETVGVLPGTAL